MRDGELDDPRTLVGVGERAQHRVADPALGPVVLDRDQATAGGGGGRRQRFDVDRLDRVEIDHAGGDPVGGERVGRLDRLVQRHAGADQRDLIVVAGAHHLGAADVELLVGAVDRVGPRPARAQVGDPVVIGHRLDQLDGLVGIGRIQDDRLAERAELGEILQRHLRRAVLADRDAGVRAVDAQLRLRDDPHPNEVVRPRQERRERRRERGPAADLEADGTGHQHLLGDVDLEVALRGLLGHLLQVGGVADLAVERDHVAATLHDSREPLPERQPGRDLVAADLVGRAAAPTGRNRTVRGAGRLGLGDVDMDRTDVRRAPRSPSAGP